MGEDSNPLYTNHLSARLSQIHHPTLFNPPSLNLDELTLLPLSLPRASRSQSEVDVPEFRDPLELVVPEIRDLLNATKG